jgi:hypothetical protein
MRSLKVLSMGSNQLAGLVRDALLLHSGSRVWSVTSYWDLCSLATQQSHEFQVAVLGGSATVRELRESAECIRRRWPNTAILLVADNPEALDDLLYDHRVSSCIEPHDLVIVIERLSRGTAMSEQYVLQLRSAVGKRHVR